MVAKSVRTPPDVSVGAIIGIIRDAVLIVIVVTNISERIVVKIQLIGIGYLRTIVNSVKNTVCIKVGFIHPNPDIVVVTLVKVVAAVGCVSI